MPRIKELLRPWDTALARIKPPRRSYEDFDRFVAECEAAGLIARTETEREITYEFYDGRGRALARQDAWFKAARMRGQTYDEAERALNRQVDLDRLALRAAEAERLSRYHKASSERDPKPQRHGELYDESIFDPDLTAGP